MGISLGADKNVTINVICPFFARGGDQTRQEAFRIAGVFPTNSDDATNDA
jgi:hypothetical protein